jgi:hypothetical protein
VGSFDQSIEPIVFQVPDFGDRFWVYALWDARTDEFSNIGKQYQTKPGFYMTHEHLSDEILIHELTGGAFSSMQTRVSSLLKKFLKKHGMRSSGCHSWDIERISSDAADQCEN